MQIETVNQQANQGRGREDSHNTKAAKQMREEETSDLRDIVNSWGGEKNYELKVIRKQPIAHNGVNCGGHVGTFEEWQDEDALRQQFGGGTYSLQVYAPNGKGSMVYFKSLTVKIAGPPHGVGIEPDDEPEDFRVPPPSEDGLGAQAMATMQELIKIQQNSGMDPAMIELIVAPMRMQVEQLQAQQKAQNDASDKKDDRILELISKKPETSSSDLLMGRMWDSQASRADSMRDQHSSELRIMQENARDEIRRLEDRHSRALDTQAASLVRLEAKHADDMRRQEDAHKRELSNIERSFDNIKAATGIGTEATVNMYKMENTRLIAEVVSLKTEVTSLKLIKEKPLMEQMEEISKMGEQMSNFGFAGFGGKEEEPGMGEKLLSMVTDNPEMISTVVQGLGAIGNAAPVAAPVGNPQSSPQVTPSPDPQEQQKVELDDIPEWQPFKAQDGNLYAKVPGGEVVTFEKAKEMAAALNAETPTGPGPTAESNEKPDDDAPSDSQVKLALTFAEGAFRNETPPETFAKTAKTSLPGSILTRIKTVGVDSLLDGVAEFDPSSALLTQAGRNYMREVAKFLIAEESE